MHPEAMPQFSKGLKQAKESTEAQQIEESFTVFIGGIPKHFTKGALLEYLSQFGKVVKIVMPFQEVEENHKGFARVRFSSPKEVDFFLSFGDHKIDGEILGISKWISKAEYRAVKGLPLEDKVHFHVQGYIDDCDLHLYFSIFGKVDRLQRKWNYKTGILKDMGFVTFEENSVNSRVLQQGEWHTAQGARVSILARKSRRELIKAFNNLIQSDESLSDKQIPNQAQFGARQTFDSRATKPIEGKKPNIYHGQSGTTNSEVKFSFGKYTQYDYLSDNKIVSHSHLKEKVPTAKQKESLDNGENHQFSKPCSKKWNHENIAKNHNDPQNVVFRIFL